MSFYTVFLFGEQLQGCYNMALGIGKKAWEEIPFSFNKLYVVMPPIMEDSMFKFDPCSWYFRSLFPIICYMHS